MYTQILWKRLTLFCNRLILAFQLLTKNRLHRITTCWAKKTCFQKKHLIAAFWADILDLVLMIILCFGSIIFHHFYLSKSCLLSLIHIEATNNKYILPFTKALQKNSKYSFSARTIYLNAHISKILQAGNNWRFIYPHISLLHPRVQLILLLLL